MKKEPQELYHDIFARVQTGIYIVQDRKFQYVNPQFEQFTGYKSEELIGRDPLELVYPDDREMVRREAVRRLKGEESSAYEYRTVNPLQNFCKDSITPLEVISKGCYGIQGAYG